jgi:hypothetical protein
MMAVVCFRRLILRNHILPPFLMEIAFTSARIKGLKTYWGEYILAV